MKFDEPVLWSYWEGAMSPLISLCVQTLVRHNPSYRLLSREDVCELGGEEVLEFTEGMRPCFRSDLLRLWLLKEFGGAWVDTDVVCLSPLSFLPITYDYDLVGIYNPRDQTAFGKHMTAQPLGGRVGSPLLEKGFEQCKELLGKMKDGESVMYSKTSAGINSPLMEEGLKLDKYKVKRFQHWRISPIQWPAAQTAYACKARRMEHEANRLYNVHGQMYHLSSCTRTFQKHTVHDLLRSKTFLAFLLGKGLGYRPALMGRAWACLKRISRTKQVRGVEVGVFRGNNARDMLQQRPNLHLRLVDSYGNFGRTYRSTGDPKAWFGRAKWAGIRKDAEQLLKPLEDRFTWDRRMSRVAATSVPDGSLDFVFIDADHSYEAVQEDIRSWKSKVVPGGWIGGHDYDKCKPFYGVARAVDEFVEGNGGVLELDVDDTWFVKL